MKFDKRITRMRGIGIPVIQAPMGWIARSQLASPVSSAGGMTHRCRRAGRADPRRDPQRVLRDRARTRCLLPRRALNGTDP